MDLPEKTVTGAPDPAGARRPTLSDVARLARVSTATASRALSNPDMVSTETRQSVFDAAKQTGYRPNLLARSLRKQEARAIVVLVPSLANMFYPEIIGGMEAAARTRDYSLLLGLTLHDHAIETIYLELVRNQRADGILVLDGGLRQLPKDTQQFKTKSVQVIERLPGVDMPWVGIDDKAATEKAMRHLLDLGHRRIGHISGLKRYSVTPNRIAGYRSALKAAGIAFDPALVVSGDFLFSGGVAAAQTLMSLPDPPTALCCGNDESALGALRQLRAMGLRVPQDVSVIGFDDTPIAATADPPLTTMRQPRHDIGFTAMTMLLDILAGTPVASPQVTLPVDLVLRDSTAPPRRR
jgi:LacI family transcriptional regulator, repressor for deo operon, udp, cdd, tsx, nupC, and nupG